MKAVDFVIIRCELLFSICLPKFSKIVAFNLTALLQKS